MKKGPALIACLLSKLKPRSLINVPQRRLKRLGEEFAKLLFGLLAPKVKGRLESEVVIG